jgi:hypothetical protein
MTTKKVYQKLAVSFNARQNCIQSNNETWRERHEQTIQDTCENYLPHGAGFDVGTSFDLERSRDNRLVLCTSFHHMDEYGYYCGWSEHDIIVTPDLIHDFMLRITGRNVRDIKDYIYQVFEIALSEEID